MTDLGTAGQFLSLKLCCYSDKLYVGQHRFALKVLRHFEMYDGYPQTMPLKGTNSSTPMSTRL
jgi:hypothetical protein